MIKVAIAEDNRRYRDTLAIILRMDEKIELIHTLEDCEDIIAVFKREKPDVVLMDIDFPGKSGIQAVWEIKQTWKEIKIIMLTVFEDEEKIFSAVKAGANGYLLKKDNPQKILNAIEEVYNGGSPINGMIAAKMLDYFQQQVHKKTQLEEANLTTREKEILQQLMKGLSYKEIASLLFISPETLNSHIKNVYRKLNVHSRSELAARYGNA